MDFHLNIGITRFIIYDNSKINDKKSYKSVEKTKFKMFLKIGKNSVLIEWTT